MTTTPTELPDVARSFTQFCKKCEQDRLHKVLVHVDPQTAKVECEICHKKSTFKLTSPKAKRKPASPRAPRSVASPRGPSWDDLSSKHSGQSTRPYRIHENFGVDSAIEHPKFGTGFIVNVSGDRIEAVFRDGTKTLIHNVK